MKGSLAPFARNVYSQNGEDGVLAEVFRRLEITNGSFVELGVGDGRQLSNTLLLVEQGWSGVWIECNFESCQKATAMASRFDGRVLVLNEMVAVSGQNRLDMILAKANFVPQIGGDRLPYLDFMSIDIDSFDLQVFDSLQWYLPRVMLIEINSSYPVGVEVVYRPGIEGSSFTSMMKVADKKGYRLACHTGNLLFVHERYFDKLELPKSECDDPTSLFDDTWVRWAAKKP